MPDLPAKVVPSPPVMEPALAPPGHLPEKMRATWNTVVGMLGPRSQASAADLISVELMVRQYHRVMEAGALIDDYGIATRRVSGDVGASPFARIERDASAMLLRLLEQYGLTLQSRMRLGLMQLSGRSLAQTLTEELNRP